MKISLDIPDSFDPEIMAIAEKDGHKNRAAAIRKMVLFYLGKESQNVAFSDSVPQKKTKPKVNRSRQ